MIWTLEQLREDSVARAEYENSLTGRRVVLKQLIKIDPRLLRDGPQARVAIGEEIRVIDKRVGQLRRRK